MGAGVPTMPSVVACSFNPSPKSSMQIGDKEPFTFCIVLVASSRRHSSPLSMLFAAIPITNSKNNNLQKTMTRGNLNSYSCPSHKPT